MFNGWHDRAKRTCTWNDPSFGVTTPQWPWEINTLVDIYRELAPRVTVEIGTYCGGTLQYWLEYAHAGALVIGIDPQPLSEPSPPPNVLFEMRKTRSDDPETLAIVSSHNVGFLFIDGDHSYNGVRYDFETYGPLVGPGGIIAFHDIITERDTCGVPRLWQEIREAGYKVRELYAAHGMKEGGIGVVYV